MIRPLDDIRPGDRVRFNAEASRSFPAAHTGHRFCVIGVARTPGIALRDCHLDDGNSWSSRWLERVVD